MTVLRLEPELEDWGIFPLIRNMLSVPCLSRRPMSSPLRFTLSALEIFSCFFSFAGSKGQAGTAGRGPRGHRRDRAGAVGRRARVPPPSGRRPHGDRGEESSHPGGPRRVRVVDGRRQVCPPRASFLLLLEVDFVRCDGGCGLYVVVS